MAIDMHDYTVAARRYWWGMIAAGASVIAYSIWSIATLPAPMIATALIGVALAGLAGLAPVRVPGTKFAMTGGEVFVFLMLLFLGVPGAVLAAASDAAVGSTRASKRWTSRLGAPTMAAVSMFACGWAFEWMRDGAEAAGLGKAGLLASVLACAVLYAFVAVFVQQTLLALKQREPVMRFILPVPGRPIILLSYVASGAVAGLVYFSSQQYGWIVVLLAMPVIILFMATSYTLGRLERSNRNKSNFLANMSHELRTPLNSIIGGAALLKEGMVGPLNPAQARWARDIHESGEHLLAIINGLLDLSKIEAGRMELDISEFDMPAAIANATALVSEAAARRGIAIAREVDPAVGAVVADQRRVKQVLVNLLSNAVKFTAEGGRVTVKVRRGAGFVEIGVADTGVGISKADQENLFEPFRQVGSDHARKAAGTGLGLALVRDLVRLHGGSVGLESEPGKGSVFTVRLPDRALQRERPMAVESSGARGA